MRNVSTYVLWVHAHTQLTHSSGLKVHESVNKEFWYSKKRKETLWLRTAIRMHNKDPQHIRKVRVDFPIQKKYYYALQPVFMHCF